MKMGLYLLFNVFWEVKMEGPTVRLQTIYGGKTPFYATDGSVGADLYSADNIWIPAKETQAVRTGVKIELPQGYAGLICPRSGMAKDLNITVANAPGVIDHDFRGEVLVLLHNRSTRNHYIKEGNRIAQLLIVPAIQAHFEVVESLTETLRGDGGFGSTGL